MVWDEIIRLREKEIPQAQFNLEKEMANATRCTANLSGMPGSHQPGSVLENSYAKIEQRKDELMRLIYRLDELKALAMRAIATLDSDKEKRVMILFFFKGESVTEIEKQLFLSKKYGYQLIRTIQKKLALVLENMNEGNNEVPTVS